MVSDNANTYVAGYKVIENLPKTPLVEETLYYCESTWMNNPKRVP